MGTLNSKTLKHPNPFSMTFHGLEKWKKFSRMFKDVHGRVATLYCNHEKDAV